MKWCDISRLGRMAALLSLPVALLAGCGLWLPPPCDSQQNIELVEAELFAQGRKKYGSLTKYASYTISAIDQTKLDLRNGKRFCTAYVDLRVEFPTSLGPLETELRIAFTARLSGLGGEAEIEVTQVERL